MQGAIFDSTFNIFFKLKYGKVYDAILATPLGVGGFTSCLTEALEDGRRLLLVSPPPVRSPGLPRVVYARMPPLRMPVRLPRACLCR
jgi:hypothetical protein